MANLNTKDVNEPRQMTRLLRDFPHEILVNIFAYMDLRGLLKLQVSGRVFAKLISHETLIQHREEYFAEMIDCEGRKIRRLISSLADHNREGESLVRLGVDESSGGIKSLICYSCLEMKPFSEFTATSQRLPLFLRSPRIERITNELQRTTIGWIQAPEGPVKPPALDRCCRTCNPDQYHPLPACIECGTFGGWKLCDHDEWVKKGVYCMWDWASAPRTIIDKSNHQVGPFCGPCRTRYFDRHRLPSESSPSHRNLIVRDRRVLEHVGNETYVDLGCVGYESTIPPNASPYKARPS